MVRKPLERGKAHLWVVEAPPRVPSSIPPRLPEPTLDDSQLLAAIRAGEPDAASALHDRLRPAVERAVRRLVGRNDPDREDLAQQAMIAIVTTIDRFRGECPLDAWARSVAAHVVYKQIRRRTTERRIFDAFRPDDESPQSTRSTRSLVHETTARNILRRVMDHLEQLDPAKAWAYYLHDVCGYDLREIAMITESTVAAAQSRLVRGRKELEARLGADPELAPMLAKHEQEGGR